MKGLRILFTGSDEFADHHDLVVTPQAMVDLHLSVDRNYLKPIDFISRQEIRDIKQWSVETVMAMDIEWHKYNYILPNFIQAIGTDLAVLLEEIKETDTVLSNIWNTNNYSHIYFDLFQTSKGKIFSFYNMLEYESATQAYIDLLNDRLWSNQKKIKVIKNVIITSNNYYTRKNVFHKPMWKRSIKNVLAIYRLSRQLKINLLSILFIKLGITLPPIPSLFVVPHKENSEMLSYKKSVILNDYLAILPKEPKKIEKLQSELIHSLESWFSKNTPVMENIKLYKNIVLSRLINFIITRTDLLSAYIKIRNIKAPPLKMVLPSAIGCGTDAWCALAIEERDGMVVSTQHGGNIGNAYNPVMLFCDTRFSYFFSYGKPESSPTFKFTQKYGKAKWVKAGSPVFYKIRKKCGAPPNEIKRILYIMDFSVIFYSTTFPWEFLLKQFQVLELLNKYSDKYLIHVKEELTGTVQHSNYPGLNFIKKSPKNVIHEYDMLIVESGLSTGVLEAAVTNKYMVVFTAAEWEDTSKESLDMLSKRAECFHTWDDFLEGLQKILNDPKSNLDSSKLDSKDFIETYCNPVSPDDYIETIKKTLKLA